MQKGDRTGDILLEIAPPARFVSGGRTYSNKGSHGYLNTLPDMGALFIAAGPAFKKGATLPAFSNLEIYPALAEILGIKPLSPIDGKIDVLEDGLIL
jgi:predicted AlkP superfamily pyrophosphatase or phosphodiesterase